MLMATAANAVSITPIKATLSGKRGASVDLVFKVHGGPDTVRVAIEQLNTLSDTTGKPLTKTVIHANALKQIPITFKLTESKRVFICAVLLPLDAATSSASFLARTCSVVTLKAG